ncbi:30S ribosomal protein S7 [Candidatus Daviesbacteria bacterium RIFCSPLOWO2_02_FULL_40_8]|uniref:Small ribosomal subunit protein uS7 n=1 Tax=Candidatus Daviesbacteria bacterium RIFCSPLOWO2_01_FULL_40_24 TaxID=1797787 RepID=A0A1F5MJY8_9BACT|nr:MAG: 30S ribosomal protein S7 [Candidatus Daviesbacteria bacterium RIFCSPHIGHO2_01_FULL_41_45]OGE35367.1 MAG: 30S ribosomal protein S7 [Candidatus Daviesbacteria bacterium RIFCSPHIGHO2_02_FULL_41_14]OGE65610.1 MAG: 30S ribosomal protein S7 [Candidatus Daviesbacteria bacterium RIFCSPLOWO2_01_FULL_40_24]OGE67057.1 MAG: 30S ribosomal protein S7 [Candidatus Daviesbacteria bacterium RIFCSPLOWO2_02_FULL_40_8]
MPRSGKVIRRILTPDPIYGSRLVTRFVNRMMMDGKKSVALGLMYKGFEIIEKTGQDPLRVFETAIANVVPKMEVKPRRIGGASYQIPVEVRGDRREALAIRWLIEAARARSNNQFHTFADKLAQEFLDAADNKGAAVAKKDNSMRAAEANKAFAHFRF